MRSQEADHPSAYPAYLQGDGDFAGCNPPFVPMQQLFAPRLRRADIIACPNFSNSSALNCVNSDKFICAIWKLLEKLLTLWSHLTESRWRSQLLPKR